VGTLDKEMQEANENLRAQLQKALAECAALREENDRLKKLFIIPPEKFGKESRTDFRETPSTYIYPQGAPVTNHSSIESKVALFRSLFRGREDVYPVRWEGREGKAGYSPACANEWNREFCGKPKVKCGACENRELLPVTDEVIQSHLVGKSTIGIYPLLMDETCFFLAVDFDKKSWKEDAATYFEICTEMGIPAALERSRSGNGSHVWIFFDSPIQASLARKLGCIILTRAMGRRHQIELDSYDRFFPNQDTMPKGGFGNLIALPLQRGPREKGNSVFVNAGFEAYPDQWEFLSSIRRVQPEEAGAIIRQAERNGQVIDVRLSLTEGSEEEDPWVSPKAQHWNEVQLPKEELPETIRVINGNVIYVEKRDLPASILKQLVYLAAFQNPEFYRAQAMRLSTFGKPRIIGCAEDFGSYLTLPRGCLDDLLAVFRSLNIRLELSDKRITGVAIDVTFHGQLYPAQQKAANALLANDIGILSAPTAFGKTAVAAWIIAERKLNTLVLVHRRQLLDQWQERLALFLGLQPYDIGQIGGGKNKATGSIDVGILQSLSRKGRVNDIVKEYGQVIVDECHHISAFTFEQTLKQVRGKYVVGLTATPIRKDGHHPIIMMQCGPIRFKETDKKIAATRPFEHKVITRSTEFNIPPELKDPSIQDVYSFLMQDERRNDLIFNDLLESLKMGRSPLLLSERVEHVELFASRLENFARNVIVLKGGMGKNQRKALGDRIKAIPDGEERILIATGRYIGEGFDDARLDTLFLAMPISWRGTLQQYVGRLHRLHDTKQVVQVYDYVDIQVPILMRMYKKRVKGYKAIGYLIHTDPDL
jgi:superfamily II DNA or RNA helicase